MVDKMDAQITLTTSDDPPISLTISRSALVTHSKVFADMLSLDLKGGKAGGPVPFDEPEDIIRVFVLMAEGREEELKGALSKVDEKGWLALAAFADKYDSWGMRNLVVLKGWELHSTSKLPLLAFALATSSSNAPLLKATAKGALLAAKLDDYTAIGPVWRYRLHAWRARQIEKVFNVMRSGTNQLPPHPPFCTDQHVQRCTDQQRCKREKVWQSLAVLALSDFDLSKTPLLPVGKHLLCAEICDGYKRTLQPWVVKFEKETSEWIEFDV